ncbi:MULTISPECIES: hypothetical protein [Acinetobacter calcoaceticus/baumannii complex]|uniref:hypothetical protein n=1 Tax=Acinetobacter calcoaceticus/baumannii complex TaxID=909768 RepID=UPI000CE3488A|nr:MULTISPECIES: hypothetical protein [Acinetobacter calcoaceticus/baumannii complex]MBD0476738.1 hypothetical protein [Acinetobacter baumannii]MCP9174361.1 hypothetical protein [Acinetobacter baumannii]MCZ2937057.1 hypothetical protein [Acinetobacter baumannii]MDQ8923221.1 hypothetical protein [Acinetobacter baumannii]MDQ8926618.1 hypothetical protein [Acinetobacter baumannii]
MTLDHLTAKQKELIEKLAAIEHKRWAHWQRYLHSQCLKNDDGSLTIPADLVKKWNKQIDTDYFNLTESEKDSDREQVLKYLPLLNSFTLTNKK